MNPTELQGAIDNLKKTMGDALIASDVWVVEDGFPIAGYNSLPKAAALFNQLGDHLVSSLEASEAQLPPIGEYFYVRLVENKGALLIFLDKYRVGVLFDHAKIQLGFIFNILLPQFMDKLEKILLS